MAENISTEAFLIASENIAIVDVRSPAEFERGHIPTAINIPLFSNEEREIVGTLYKQSGKQAAIFEGLKIVGPKMPGFAKQAIEIAVDNKILVHCWRGGMRSQNMAWLFETVNLNVKLLKGGYKAYRQFVRSQFEREMEIMVLGGKTGSGKTDILRAMSDLGEQVIDLEGLAHHKGSSFGAMGQGLQPGNEQFENDLGKEWMKLDFTKKLWLEDESKMIGSVSMSEPLYKTIRNSPVIFLEVPKHIRVKRLVSEYAGFNHKLIQDAIERIQKRLGGLNVKLALEALTNNDYHTVASILLIYYDSAYLKGLSFRNADKVFKLRAEHDNANTNAKMILEYCNDNSL